MGSKLGPGGSERWQNRSETGFTSQISRRSQEATAEPIKPPEPRGVALQMCHVAYLEGDTCVAVAGRACGFSVAVAGLG